MNRNETLHYFIRDEGVAGSNPATPTTFPLYSSQSFPDNINSRPIPRPKLLNFCILCQSANVLCITIAANIADTAILGIDACFPDSVVGFTPKGSEALAYFVKYLIDVNKQDLESFAPATAQKNINLKVLNELRLPFPSLEEQTEIVRRVDQLFAHADRIEQQVNNALARVNNLTQSILAKAFRGELTEQWRKDNPELISGDNSAEALLERIKAERAAAKPAKKTRSKRATV